jgi:hypothetical protein
MAYIGKAPFGNAVRTRFFYTASGGETSLSGADSNGKTLAFTDGNYVDVYLNGVLLITGTDYNTSTENTIAGLSALAAGDNVEIVVYETFSLFNSTFNGNVTINEDLTVDTNTLYVDSTNNRVGIGTSSPATALDVNGTVTTNGGAFTGDVTFGDNDKAIFGAGSDLQIYHDGSDSYVKDAGTGYLNLLGTGRVVVGHPSNGHVYLNANYGGDVELFFNNSKKLETTSTGIDVTGTVTADGLTVDGTASMASTNELQFFSSAYGIRASTGLEIKTGDFTRFLQGTTEHLRIDSSGNVGIGTSSPAIYGVDNADDLVIGQGDGNHGITISSYGTSNGTLAFSDQNNATVGRGFVDYDHNVDAMSFGTLSSERMRIDSSGNVGIGTSSPVAKLHIENGDMRIEKDTKATIGFRGHTSGSTALAFRDANAAIDRMTIDSSGNVGIGTSSPSFKLDVDGEIRATNRFLANTGSGATKGYQFSGDGDTGMFSDSSNTLQFSTAGSERIRIDSSGNVGIGTSSPAEKLAVNGNIDFPLASSTIGCDFSSGGVSRIAQIEFYNNSDGSMRLSTNNSSTGGINFYTEGSERMRISRGGNLNLAAVGATDIGRLGGSVYSSGERNVYIWAGSGLHYTQVSGRFDADGSPVFQGVVGGTVRSEIEANGDFLSATNSYGSTSDQTLKENIVASGSQWDDIKAVQVKKFSYIEDDLDAPNMLGVIAQDLEESGMNGLVKTKTKTRPTEDGEEEVVLDDDGNPVTYKTVKYSVLYMKAIKALQEAITKIEALEAENADFETRLTALEN